MLARLILCAALLTAAAPTPAAPRRLSDSDLLRLAASKFDARKMMFRHDLLGVHRGVRVVADYPCGDVCPQYTRRIIHYVAVAECGRTGGVVVSELVPRGPAVGKRDFCEPAVLARDPHRP